MSDIGGKRTLQACPQRICSYVTEVALAGTILIDEQCGVALNSIGYHRIIEAIRVRINWKDNSWTQRIIEPNDEESMTFISLIEADRLTFQTFERAAIAAYSEAVTSGEAFPEWDELMQKLASDPRSADAR